VLTSDLAKVMPELGLLDVADTVTMELIAAMLPHYWSFTWTPEVGPELTNEELAKRRGMRKKPI